MKASAIMVCPLHHLPTVLSDQERDVLRKVLLDGIRGIDDEHDRRWRRFIGILINSEPGEVTEFLNPRTRSLPFHRRHRAMLARLFESQDRFRHINKLHDWLKVGAGFVTWEPGTDNKPVAIPRSTDFESCSEDEIREAHMAMVDFLHTDYATKRLWGHLKARQRQEMVDAILENPKDRQ